MRVTTLELLRQIIDKYDSIQSFINIPFVMDGDRFGLLESLDLLNCDTVKITLVRWTATPY